MLALSLLLLPLCGLPVSARGIFARDSLLRYKRQTATCESTYGAGSEPCGGDGDASGFCFSPNQGQSCCAIDSGFCDAGRYCAPVAGFCCLEGEDLETCAKNAGFELPISVSNATVRATYPAALQTPEVTTIPGPTKTIIPILKQSSSAMATATAIVMQNVTCEFATSANSMMMPVAATPSILSASTVPTLTVPTTAAVQSVPTAISNTNGTSPSHPLVEVSFAVRRACTSVGLMRMVAVIAASIVFW
ncbi:hypothetical protein F4818DRAFT_436814 [Hypoxylon cercidicola]|nr:hypothetical protein F4818DRAFT_436814 [Hypoxylon cercidicola]